METIRLASMEVNQIYSSLEEQQLDGNIFVVDVEENETSVRLRLRGEYSLKIWTGGLSLLTLNTDHALYYWPYTVLRRYGTSKTGFTFEAGRKSPTGPGVLRFSSPSGRLITQTIKDTVAVIKGEKLMPNSQMDHSRTAVPDTSDQRTHYSRTAERPIKNPKPAESHGELLLEIPNQSLLSSINNNRPKSARIEDQRPRDLLLNLVSPYVVSPETDNSTRLTYQLAANQLSPRMPAPYNSLTRSQDKSNNNYFQIDRHQENFLRSEESCGSTFPACVSPVPRTIVEGDSSSDEELSQSSRKISQITPSNTTADQDPIHLSLSFDSKASSSQPIGSNYVNVERRNLSKSNSSNFHERQSGTENSKRLSLDVNEEPSADYMNVLRKDAANQQSEYYNITREISQKAGKSSDFKFSLGSQEMVDSEMRLGFQLPDPNPVGQSNELEYGEVHMHPTSHPTPSPGLYVNTQIQRPSYVNVSASGNSNRVEEAIYGAEPTVKEGHLSKRISTMPTSPPSCLDTTRRLSNAESAKSSNTIKLNPRSTHTQQVHSEYSYLSDILSSDPPPELPRAYVSVRGQIKQEK